MSKRRIFYDENGVEQTSFLWTGEQPPEITVAQRDALTPQEGMVYRVEGIGLQVYRSGAWRTLTDSGTKGKVLQIVFAETETAVTVSTTTWTDTSLTASITPRSATSKIVVMVSQATQVGRNDVSAFGGIRLLRDATVIHNPNPEDATGPFGFGRAATGSGTTTLTHYGTIALSKEDSPETTDELTYKTQGRPYETSNSGIIRFQRNEAESNAKSTMILMEVEA